MNRSELSFNAKDGIHIFYYKWGIKQNQKAKGTILILHGMAEHALRYEDFASFLNKNGYIVYACDHRGHGKTGIGMGIMGYFGNYGWDLVVNDIHDLVKIIKNENKDIPFILLGHSMGSILARTCISNFGHEFDGVILSGTTNGISRISRKLGLSLSKITACIIGKKKKSPFLQLVFFGNYNKKFASDYTAFAWLTRDKKIVQKYIEDELCGFVCTSGFFFDMMSGINRNAKKENLLKVPKNLPMFIFSGTMDPVGAFGKDVKETYRLYEEIAGLKNVNLKLYKNGRHEMLNEINKEEVYQDVYNWLDKNNL